MGPAGFTYRYVTAMIDPAISYYGIRPDDVGLNRINVIQGANLPPISDGTQLTITSGTPPGGLSIGDVYFVRNLSFNGSSYQFSLAATFGGSAISVTSNGSGVMRFYNIPDVTTKIIIAEGNPDPVNASDVYVSAFAPAYPATQSIAATLEISKPGYQSAYVNVYVTVGVPSSG